MQDELLTTAALPAGVATESTDTNNPTEPAASQSSDRLRTVEVDKGTGQTESTRAIGATGPPQVAYPRTNDVLVPSSAVRKKLGNVSDMTLWRRLKYDPKFPRPKVMGGRRYWWESTIDEYIEQQPNG